MLYQTRNNNESQLRVPDFEIDVLDASLLRKRFHASEIDLKQNA